MNNDLHGTKIYYEIGRCHVTLLENELPRLDLAIKHVGNDMFAI